MPLITTLAGASARGYGGLVTFGVPSSYESIATVTVGSGGAANVEFTSIPATYTHLQIRGIYRNNNSADDSVGLQFNSDTGSNYSQHGLYGNGSSAGSYGSANTTDITIWPLSAVANTFGTAIIDILDYKDTNKYKTVRSLTGYDNNGSGFVLLQSGSWRSTSAISSIQITTRVGTFQQYTNVALYGIKVAS